MTPLELLEKCVNADRPDLACPGLAPPAGELSLDLNAPSVLPTAQDVSIVCCVLVGIAMIIRVFTRSYLVKKFALEDAMMILSTLLFIAFVALVCDSAKLVLGKHQWDLTLADLMRALHRAYPVQIIYCLAIYAVKLGVLLQIKHIFAGRKKDFNYWACWVVIVFVSCGYTANLFIWIFPCVPVERSWNFFIDGHCNNAKPSIISGVVNLVSDVAILVLPIIAVAQLHMSLRKKLAVSAVFATGMFALRLYYSVVGLEGADYTYWIAVVATCAITEIAAALLCGCFPTFPRFYKWIKNERHQNLGYQRSGPDYALGSVEWRRLVNDVEKRSPIGTAI